MFRIFAQLECKYILYITLFFIAVSGVISIGLTPVEAANCKVSYETHNSGVKPGKLLNPYHTRMPANSYIPMAYAIGSNAWRTMTLESRLAPQKSYSACKKIMRKCFKAKIDKKFKDYRYCLKVNNKGKISKAHRIR